MTADQIIDLLGLEPLPDEGGMWSQTWRDEAGTAIYFLLRPHDFSALHRLTGAEVWHHYAGAPVQMVLLEPGGGVRRPLLGDDLAAGHRPCVVVEGGVWMGAHTTGEWSLTGTTMAPPWTEDQFELGEAEALVASHPAATDDIMKLTRRTP